MLPICTLFAPVHREKEQVTADHIPRHKDNVENLNNNVVILLFFFVFSVRYKNTRQPFSERLNGFSWNFYQTIAGKM